MSYIVPSVLVYQQLASSGGVLNATPDLDSAIVGPCYNVVEYDGTSASALTSTAALDSAGAAFQLTDNSVSNVVNLPGQKPGQNVEESSVEVYVNDAIVETLSSKFTGAAGASTITVLLASGVGTTTAGSAVVTAVSNVTKYTKGDVVTIAGAGAAGATLSAVITSIDEAASTVTLSTPALTAGAAKVMTKSPITNANSVTATRRVEPGDVVVIKYTVAAVEKVFTTAVVSVQSLTGVVTSIELTDILPSDTTGNLSISVRKKYNNQLLLKSYNGYTNYDDSTVGADGEIEIKPVPKLAYGDVISGSVHIAYRALRTDLSGTILDIEDVNDLRGKLGEPSDRNPLALGVQIALANTVGRILAIATPSEDLAGFQAALELAEGRRLYCLVPLTQDDSIIPMFKLHAEQMSTAEEASWRIALVNTEIPTIKYVGTYNEDNVNANEGSNAITLVNGRYILTASNAAFLSDGAVPGDIVQVTAGTGSISPIGKLQILQVINNQQVQVTAQSTATGVSYYVTRNLTKSQQSDVVASTSRTLGSNRVIHVPQGAGVTINGVTKYLPGYYICCAMAGLVSGLPVQQSLTNIGFAGIADVQFGNFYFTRAQMNNMAGAGTCLIAQESQGAIPYIRHSLTTDVTSLYLRELQQVKNWDFLSYFYYDILRGFIGRYNITSDTLQILRQTINAGSELLKGKKLPKLGAPLTNASIKTLKQSDTNKDMVIAEVNIEMPTVMNYISLYLIV